MAPRTLPGLINAYGLQWRLADSPWVNKTARTRNRLTGVQGAGGRREVVCDFWRHPGFYILYLNSVPVYVGIAKSGIGPRLRSHTHTKAGRWDEFSWFAYGPLSDDDPSSPIPPEESAWKARVEWKSAIFDLEAALIRSLKPSLSRGKGSFRLGRIEWHQAPPSIDST